MKREIYTIELIRPDGVSVAELVAYIEEAVLIWGGQRAPGDPLFYPWTTGSGKLKRGAYPKIRVKRRFP